MVQVSSEIFFLAVALVYGLVIGSFLNVCIHRLPRSRFMAEEAFECPHCQKEIIEIPCPHCGKTISEDIPVPPSKSMGGVRSQCPRCGAVIRAYDNIPVLSYLLLRGRCRNCHERISLRYPFVELASGFFAMACAARFGFSFLALIYFVLIACLLVVSFIDLDFQRIPKLVTYPAMLAGLAASFLPNGLGPWASVSGMLCGAGMVYLLHNAYWLIRRQEGMGLGDADLLAVLGAFLGWKGVFFSLMAGAFSGAILGGALAAAGKAGMKKRLPFGPFLAAGGVLFLFQGEAILSWYMGLFT